MLLTYVFPTFKDLWSVAPQACVSPATSPRRPIPEDRSHGWECPSRRDLQLGIRWDKTPAGWVTSGIEKKKIPSGYVKIAIDNCHLLRGFTLGRWWFSIAMLVYQRVTYVLSFCPLPSRWVRLPRGRTKSTVSQKLCWGTWVEGLVITVAYCKRLETRIRVNLVYWAGISQSHQQVTPYIPEKKNKRCSSPKQQIPH